MTVLLVFAALATVATVWYLTRPIRGKAALSRLESNDDLIQLRDRLLAQLRELDVEVGDRNVDSNVAADERRRLEAELAHVLRDLEARSPLPLGEGTGVRGNVQGELLHPLFPPGRAETIRARSAAPIHVKWIGENSASPPEGRGEHGSLMRWVIIVGLAVSVPLASAGLYFTKNSTVLAQLGQARTPAGTDLPPEVLDMVGRLERRLTEQPADSRGWAMLGRSYAVLGRPGEAQRAYERAYQLAPNDSEIVAAYADFLISIDPVRPSAEAAALFRKLHALEPQNPAALWGLGLVAFHEEKFGQAAKYWEQLLEGLPPESEVSAQVRRAIEAARGQAEKK